MREKDFASNRRCFKWNLKLSKGLVLYNNTRKKWPRPWPLVNRCRLICSMFPPGKLLLYHNNRRLEFVIASLLADG